MNVAIVGANRGIGLELTKEYIQSGHTVYAFCRKSSQSLDQLKPEKVIINYDVKNIGIMKNCLKGLEKIQFDRVIHVSGILKSDQLNTVDEQDLIEQFHVNSIGPILSYKAFTPYMNRGSKFSMLTSRVGSITDNSSGGNYGYRMSKAAANMAGKNLSIDAKEKNITVLILHPGYVKTEMTRQSGHVEPDESARQLYAVIEEKKISDTGTFWHANGEPLPW